MSEADRRLVISGDIAELGRLFAFLDAFCSDVGVAADTRPRLRLVAEELVANVINHGFGSRAEGRIDIALRRTDATSIEIEIADNAPAFDPLTDAPTPPIEAELADRPVGGLGILLVKKATAALHYRRRGDGWNVVTAVIADLVPKL